jgi:hypothetical protein
MYVNSEGTQRIALKEKKQWSYKQNLLPIFPAEAMYWQA